MAGLQKLGVLKTRPGGSELEDLEGMTRRHRSAASKAGWDPGAVIPALCVSMLQQGPS